MRPDRLSLEDILGAADAIGRFVSGSSREHFLEDELLQSAVLHQLMIVGEAAGRVSAGMRTAHPGVPWSDVVAFRNRVVHAYFAVNWDIVWTTATKDVPELRESISALLDTASDD